MHEAEQKHWSRTITMVVVPLLLCGQLTLAAQVDVAQPLGGGPLPAGEEAVLQELLRADESVGLLARDPAFQLHRLVLEWAQAWSRQDVDSYLGFYGQNFVPSGRYQDYNLREWRLSRRDRLRGPEWVRVEVSDLRVLRKAEDSARVRFRQDYSSATFSDWVWKTLEFQRIDGAWRITREESLQP